MPELLINDNMIYCNNCKDLKNGVHQQFIYELPKVLIIILNRGKNNADFNERFDFPPILDLRNQNVKSKCYNESKFTKIILFMWGNYTSW